MPSSNVGPEHPEPRDPDTTETPRRGNPAPVLRDEGQTDDVAAASTRASTVSHRFGGVRYALSRPETGTPDVEPPVEDEPDAHE